MNAVIMEVSINFKTTALKFNWQPLPWLHKIALYGIHAIVILTVSDTCGLIKCENFFHQTTNRKSYMLYQLAPPLTL